MWCSQSQCTTLRLFLSACRYALHVYHCAVTGLLAGAVVRQFSAAVRSAAAKPPKRSLLQIAACSRVYVFSLLAFSFFKSIYRLTELIFDVASWYEWYNIRNRLQSNNKWIESDRIFLNFYLMIKNTPHFFHHFFLSMVQILSIRSMPGTLFSSSIYTFFSEFLYF